jgi:hypothetical protein
MRTYHFRLGLDAPPFPSDLKRGTLARVHPIPTTRRGALFCGAFRASISGQRAPSRCQNSRSRTSRADLRTARTHRFLHVVARASALAVILGLSSCDPSPASIERQWRHCNCTYVSDFDDQSAAPIEVCTDEKHAEEVAGICIRNDGVGVPTGCRCEPRPFGACAKSDRCRSAIDAATR